MFLRPPPERTLAQVREDVHENTVTAQVANTDIAVDLTENEQITLTTAKGKAIELPASSGSVKALGDWLDIPEKFLSRLEPDLKQHLIQSMLTRHPATAAVVYTDEGIKQVRDPNSKIIPVHRLVDVAAKVIDPAAPVVDFWHNGNEFRVDVIAPEGFDRGIGGDRKRGDLTRGGIRIGMDTKHNLAPWTSEFMYRLICTNGMESRDEGLKVDARGSSVEEVLAEFEQIADRAFSRVERTIESFYEMRNQTIDNPERTVIRMAEERGLPSRTVLGLAERVPALEANEEGGVTMFDLVNLITNQANDPSIRNRSGARRALEMAGGAVVAEHAERCGHCQSRLT